MNNQDKVILGISGFVGIVLFGSVFPALISAKSTMLVLIGLIGMAASAYAFKRITWPVITKLFEDKE